MGNFSKNFWRETGKNTGKFVSNKVFGDGHSTPYRHKIQSEKLQAKEEEQKNKKREIKLKERKQAQLEQKERNAEKKKRLNELIQKSLVDGEVSQKEKNAIYKIAIELNLSFEEIQTTLESELYKENKTKFSDTENFIDNLNFIDSKIKFIISNPIAATMGFAKKTIKQLNSKKEELINSYILPSSKDEINDFLVFASTNITHKSYLDVIKGNSNKKLSKIWLKKIQQIKSEAILEFDYNPKELEKINYIENEVSEKLKDNLSKSKKTRIAFSAIVFTVIISIVVLTIISINQSREEESILNSQISSVKEYLETDNFTEANKVIASIYENKVDSPELISLLKNKYSEGFEPYNTEIFKNVLTLNESMKGDDMLKLKCELQYLALNWSLLQLEKLLNEKKYSSVQSGLKKLVWQKIFESSSFSDNYNQKGSEYEEKLGVKFIESQRYINNQLPDKYKIQIDNPFSIWN